jgi:hypothetical protein
MDTTVPQVSYATLDGHFWPLGYVQSVAIPSPDGKRVAFLNSIAATNAWPIDRQ